MIFNTNGGETIEPAGYKNSEITKEPKMPTKKGSTFDGMLMKILHNHLYLEKL